VGLVSQLVLSYEIKKKSETFVLCVVHKHFVKLYTAGISKSEVMRCIFEVYITYFNLLPSTASLVQRNRNLFSHFLTCAVKYLLRVLFRVLQSKCNFARG